MSTKHTPAPWRIEWGMSQGGDGHHVCDASDMGPLSIIASVHFHDDADGETKANARLIAAAPDLLAALRGLLDYGSLGAYGRAAAVNAALAAVAKATGDQK